MTHPYPFDTTATLDSMMARYAQSRRAQNVSFRKLVPWLTARERATHFLHPYPAKLLPQIAHFFLASQKLSKPGGTVLDPFGGTGTVALEAILAKRKAIFADANPLARFISQAKTTPIADSTIEKAFARIERRHAEGEGQRLSTPSVVNLNYWFDDTSIQQLNCIRSAIMAERNSAIRNFFLAAFSYTCRKVSYADPRLSVPVRINEKTSKNRKVPPSVWSVFNTQVSDNRSRMRELHAMGVRTVHAHCVGNDARELYQPNSQRRLRANSVSLAITSPPYAGAQKYIRASSLNLGWLGLATSDQLKPLENASIGREHIRQATYLCCQETGIESADRLIRRLFKINPLRSAIVGVYLNEMRAALEEVSRVLKPNGYLVLVIGNNEVCGLPFKSSEYLVSICEENGLEVKLKLIDEIKSRGLMTKRNKTAGVITREWVILFQKRHK